MIFYFNATFRNARDELIAFKFNVSLIYIKSNDFSVLDYGKIILICFTCLLSFTIIYKQDLQATLPKDFMKLGLRLSMLNGFPTLEKV